MARVFILSAIATWLLGCSQQVANVSDAWLSKRDVEAIQREHLTTDQIAKRYGITIADVGMIYRDKDHPEYWFIVNEPDSDGIMKIINLGTGDVACYYARRPDPIAGPDTKK